MYIQRSQDNSHKTHENFVRIHICELSMHQCQWGIVQITIVWINRDVQISERQIIRAVLYLTKVAHEIRTSSDFNAIDV